VDFPNKRFNIYLRGECTIPSHASGPCRREEGLGGLPYRWHNSLGGGVWLSFLGPANTLSVALARSEVGTSTEQRTSLYIQAGFAF
jgi:hypothetical protein